MGVLGMLPFCLAPHPLHTFDVARMHCRRGVDVMDLLVTLTTKQGVALLNSTQVGRRKATLLHSTLLWGTAPTFVLC